MGASADIYRPGDRVWRSGTYEVHHYQQHRRVHKGELLIGEIFPYCKECKTRVRFHFKNSLTGSSPSLAHDLSFKERTPARATAASLFKAAFGRRMTAEERAKIRNYEDTWH
jgi:hypothetical protein